MEKDCELWQLDARTGPRERGDRKLRSGGWLELIEHVKSFMLPNGNYAVVGENRRVVFLKTGNFGEPARPGKIEIIEGHVE